jgi:tetratricopeptide (TPR) repeat protein
MAEPVALKYRAFISYSHADTHWAKWLHRALEGFTIDKDLAGRETTTGTIPHALRPIFRYRDDFTAGNTPSEQTLAALDASEALIVICSPASAKSHYVSDEIRRFKARHPERPAIPLIVGGKPGDSELNCFPPALKYKVDSAGRITTTPVELLAADAREEGDGKSLALAKVVAGLLGVASDDIFRRAMRERRRRQQRWIAGLSAVALTLAGLAVWAEINRREAVVQRQEAERNFEVAKQGANSLIFDIAQALQGQQGMRTESVRKILGTAEQVIGKLVKKSHGNLELLRIQGAMLNEFADTYAAQGDTAKQEQAARRALAITKHLAQANPDNVEWQRDLSMAYEKVGDVLVAQGNFSDALEAFRATLAAVSRLAEADFSNAQWQRDLSIAHEKIGEVLFAQGDLSGSLKSFRESLAIRHRLAATHPTNVQSQRDLSAAYDRIGDALLAHGHLAQAARYFEKSVAIDERLASADPGNLSLQRTLSVSHNKLGDVRLALGKSADALKAFKRSLAVRNRLAKADPDNTEWQRDLALTHERLGDAYQAEGKLDVALEEYSASLNGVLRLRDADPSNADLQRFTSVTYSKIGDLQAALGNPAEALKSFNESIAGFERLAQADPDSVAAQRDLAVGRAAFGLFLARHGEEARADAELRAGRSIIAGLQGRESDDPSLSQLLAWFDTEIAKIGHAGAAPVFAPEQAAQ